jgi:phosphoserine aminotransferase
MLTFNVGPSKVSDETKLDIRKAIDEGILEISHRSERFTEISRDAVNGLREFLKIPREYHVFFTDSATRAIELALLNTCEKSSFHFVNGNFSKMFFDISKALGKEALKDEVVLGDLNDLRGVTIPESVDFVSITHNETSTGVVCSNADISSVRNRNKDKILAVDITSSAGLYDVAITDADLWLFSVQKGFGLPAGLGVLVVSEKALERAKLIQLRSRSVPGYFTFEKMAEKMEEKFHTIQTPNVLGIFLLGEQLKRWNSAGGVGKKIEERDLKWNMFKEFFDSKKEVVFYPDLKNASRSVLCVRADPGYVKEQHKKLAENGIISGKGYGNLKETTFRVANFPAITKEDVQRYVDALT